MCTGGGIGDGGCMYIRSILYFVYKFFKGMRTDCFRSCCLG
jgi:hypothetical protein